MPPPRDEERIRKTRNWFLGFDEYGDRVPGWKTLDTTILDDEKPEDPPENVESPQEALDKIVKSKGSGSVKDTYGLPIPEEKLAGLPKADIEMAAYYNYHLTNKKKPRHYHVEQAIKHYWPSYEDDWNPWMEQQFASVCRDSDVFSIGEMTVTVTVWTGSGSGGKAQPLDSIVQTPGGPVEMGSLKVGDLVCTPDGSAAPVIGIFDQGKKPVYTITTKNGRKVRACGEHLWKVRSTDGHRRWEIRDTSWIASRYKSKSGRLHLQFPLPEAAIYYYKFLPIDPYLLGVLIGDGAFSNFNIGLTTEDGEIVESVRELIPDVLELKKSFRKHDYRITGSVPGIGRNPLKTALRDLGLWGTKSHEKFIPYDYLYSSIKQRTSLLQGLLDTDGTATKDGKIVYYTTSKKLADGVRALVESLGGITNIWEKVPKYTYNGERKTGKKCYCVSIKMEAQERLFRLKRKSDRCLNAKKAVPQCNTIVNVEVSSEHVEMRCILVDHPDHMYLTDHCIPTHNTHCAAIWALLWWSVDPANTMVALTSTSRTRLRQRIWPILRHHHSSAVDLHTGQRLAFAGEPVDYKTSIEYQRGDDKHAIVALAIEKGETSKAVAHLKGLHAPRMMLIVDEADATAEGIFEVIPNWRKGCREFQVLILSNASETHINPFGRASEPVDGWKSISVDSKSWSTRGVSEWQLPPGRCYHFDGFKSPNVTGKKTKWNFLYSWEDYQSAVNDPEYQNTLQYWLFDRGFWPPAGVSNTVFTESLIERCGGTDVPTILDTPTILAFLDPAYDGDDAILRIGRLATLRLSDSEAKKALLLGERYILDPARDADKEKEYNIAHHAMEVCRVHNVEPQNFGIDTIGGGRAAAAIMATEWSNRIIRFASNALPDEAMASVAKYSDDREFDRMTTAHWWFARELLEANQLKGLQKWEIMQFCRRTYALRGRVIVLQSKAEYKAGNSGRSPDDADAVVGLCYMAGVAGLMPAVESKPGFKSGELPEDDEYGDENAYTMDPYAAEMAEFY